MAGFWTGYGSPPVSARRKISQGLIISAPAIPPQVKNAAATLQPMLLPSEGGPVLEIAARDPNFLPDAASGLLRIEDVVVVHLTNEACLLRAARADEFDIRVFLTLGDTLFERSLSEKRDNPPRPRGAGAPSDAEQNKVFSSPDSASAKTVFSAVAASPPVGAGAVVLSRVPKSPGTNKRFQLGRLNTKRCYEQVVRLTIPLGVRTEGGGTVVSLGKSWLGDSVDVHTQRVSV